MLTEALAEAAHLGVTVDGLGSMCGIPLCLLPPGSANQAAPNEIPANFDEGEFLKPPACEGCALAAAASACAAATPLSMAPTSCAPSPPRRAEPRASVPSCWTPGRRAMARSRRLRRGLG